MSLAYSGTPVPTVEVRFDPSGNQIGTTDLPVNVPWNGWRRAGHHLLHVGRDLVTGDQLVLLHDEAGHELWRDDIPVPAGYSTLAIGALDSNGGAAVEIDFSQVLPPHSFYEQILRYDASGHVKWNVPSTPANGGAPVGPDGSVVRSTVGTFTVPLVVTKYDSPAPAFCFGDGILAACPCGNSSTPAEKAGCANSFGHGAALAGSGGASIAADTLVLDVHGATGNALLIVQGSAFQANGGPVSTMALLPANRPLSGGSLQYPQSGDVPISVRGGVVTSRTSTYQGFYRNSASFCTSSTLATTNGVAVHWQP